MKKKLSATIEEDAYELLTRAAGHEGMSVSEMLERAVRHALAGHAPRALELTRLDNGGCSIRLSEEGRTLYSYRATRRHAVAGVQATLRIDLGARLDVDRVGATLRSWRDEAVKEARSGRPQTVTRDGLDIELDDLPPRAESDPSWIRDLLERFAATVEALEFTDAGQLARRRCPRCREFMTRLRVWQEPGAPSADEEREWTCSVGHLTRVRAGSAERLDGTCEPPPARDAASAFSVIGRWEGESEDEIQELLEDGRHRGGQRTVPEL